MCSPPRSLNLRVAWPQLAAELGIEIHAAAVPAAVACPLCRTGVMRVYRDALLGGAWFHCRSCGRQGDMIELAAAAWELEIPETIDRLRRSGFDLPRSDDEIQAYFKQHVDYRRRLQHLWQSGGRRVDDCRQVIRLARQAGLYYELFDARQEHGPYRMLRVSDAPTVERCFAPASMAHAAAGSQRCNPSQGAVFTGRGWDQVLMVPYYDVPWRICGFTFLGRAGDDSKDIVFRRANFGQGALHGFEAGLAMDPRVLETSQRWGHKIIAIDDLVFAWRLQTRHLVRYPFPLPLVAWHDSRLYPGWHAGRHRVRTVNAWEMLEGREIVFWMPQPNPSTFEQAIAVNAKITTVGPRESNAERLREYAWKHCPEDLVNHILANARPWPVALSDYLDKLSGPAIEDVLAKFDKSGVAVGEVLDRVRRSTRAYVAGIRDATRAPLSMQHGKCEILERDCRWYAVARNGQQTPVMNAVLRIDALISTQDDSGPHYAGRVIHEGREIPFCVRGSDLEKDTPRWIRNLVMTHLSAVVVIDPRWARHLTHLALMLQPPEPVTGVARVGYDRQEWRFVFPQFTIDTTGKVGELKYPVFPGPVPAADLGPPQVLSPEEIDRPKYRGGRGVTEVFWAVAAGVLANILAPLYGHRQYGIVLRGIVAGNVGRAVARALGCVEYRPGTITEIQRARSAERHHDWPVLTEISPILRRRHQRQYFESVDDGADRNCIAAVDFATAKLLGMQDGWHTIHTQHEGTIDGSTLQVAGMLIPAYLQDLGERSFERRKHRYPPGRLVDFIMEDLAGYATRHHGDGGALLSARRAIVLDDADSRVGALADLLGYCIRARTLEVRPRISRRRKPALIEHSHKGRDGLLLRDSVLERLVTGASLVPPSAEQLHRVLQEAGVLLAEEDDGLVFCREWFAERCRSMRIRLPEGQLTAGVR